MFVGGVLGVVGIVREVRRLYPDLPAVVMTAYAEDDSLSAAKDWGAMDVLIKPIDVEQLLGTLKRFIAPSTRILIVEDDQQLRTLLGNYLSRFNGVIVTPASEINYLSGPGKGVRLIKVGKDDRLLGFKASRGDRDLLTVETNRGAKKNISTVKYRTTSRGGVGTEIQKNGRIKCIVADEVPAPILKGRAPKGGL